MLLAASAIELTPASAGGLAEVSASSVHLNWLAGQRRLLHDGQEAPAPGLTARAVLETLVTIQMLDVTFPTTDGRRLVLPRYTLPTPEQKLLLQQLRLSLPDQPPPRIQLQPEVFPPGMLRL